jgi:two-component system, sensor histidine kinase LadS
MKYPDERLEYINKKMTEVMPTKNLISCFLVNIFHDKIYYASASHPNQYLFRANGTFIPLMTKGIMLGIQNDLTFDMKEENIGKGDTLFLFSDGIFEEFNNRDEEFGLENLQSFFSGLIGEISPEAINRKLLKKLEEFRNGIPIHDDITLICIKIK